jgi:hypothetical protein
LNDVPLMCKYIPNDFKWVVELADANSSLNGGFSIGHKTHSETIYPAAYSPHTKDYSYIDTPGFEDTRGIGVEIANSFFRKEITKDVTHLKFLLLIKHEDLKDRGQQFRDSIKLFSTLLGFNFLNESISKCIGIIVTRVENEHLADEEMKVLIQKKLLEILEDERSKLAYKQEKLG